MANRDGTNLIYSRDGSMCLYPPKGLKKLSKEERKSKIFLSSHLYILIDARAANSYAGYASACSEKVPVIQHSGQGKLEEWAIIYSEKALKQTVPVYCAWEINERMYGDPQGRNRS